MREQRANHPISVNPKPEPVSDPAGNRRAKQQRRLDTNVSARRGHRTAAAWRWRELSPSLSPPPAGCRTRRGPRSPACASAATPSSELIGPTRCEDRSIGSSRRKWRKIAPRKMGGSNPAQVVSKRKRRRRGIRPASAIGGRSPVAMPSRLLIVQEISAGASHWVKATNVAPSKVRNGARQRRGRGDRPLSAIMVDYCFTAFWLAKSPWAKRIGRADKRYRGQH